MVSLNIWLQCFPKFLSSQDAFFHCSNQRRLIPFCDWVQCGRANRLLKVLICDWLFKLKSISRLLLKSLLGLVPPSGLSKKETDSFCALQPQLLPTRIRTEDAWIRGKRPHHARHRGESQRIEIDYCVARSATSLHRSLDRKSVV